MEKEKILNQLNRIEGQIRGIHGMIDGGRGLVPTMQQLMAAHSSLRKVMISYIQLFIAEKEKGRVELTQEQLQYILNLLGK